MSQKKEITHSRMWTTAQRLIGGGVAPFEIVEWFQNGGPVYDGRTGRQLTPDIDLDVLCRMMFGTKSHVVSAKEEMTNLAFYKSEDYSPKDAVVKPNEPGTPQYVYIRTADIEPFVAATMKAAGHTNLEIFCALFPEEYHRDSITVGGMNQRIYRMTKESQNQTQKPKAEKDASMKKWQGMVDRITEGLDQHKNERDLHIARFLRDKLGINVQTQADQSKEVKDTKLVK